MVEKLWGDEQADYPGKTGYRRVIKELNDTLKLYNAEEILVRERGSLRIKKNIVDCDYYEAQSGDKSICLSFQGEFMKQYSWAEEAVFGLYEKKKLIMANMKL